MNKKILLLVLLVAGAGLGYMIYMNYYGECCKTSTETSTIVETPTGITKDTKKSEIKTETKTDIQGNEVEEKKVTKTSEVKKKVKSCKK